MIIKEDTRVVLADLPSSIKGYTTLHDGFYTIMLNSRLNREQRMEAYEHELFHITNNHFDCDKEMRELELIAHYH